jgi:hypothetical protein
MHQYKVFRNGTGVVEAVKQGWSWPGFFFSSIWALVKHLWVIALASFFGPLILGLLAIAMGAEVAGFLILNLGPIVLCIVFGTNGNAWREANLISRGYELAGTVDAPDPDSAVRQCMAKAALGEPAARP